MPDDVRSRFAPVAANYARAKFHTSSERLREVVDLAQPKPTDLALDVATGTGNTALALAPFVTRVVGVDLTTEMLDQARRVTRERGVTNAEWVLGDACRLPFADDSFDLYTVRAAPHHFHDFDAFLTEALRVLKPGHDAAFVDCAPPAEARDLMHEVEVRRDPSHIRSLTVAEWTERLTSRARKAFPEKVTAFREGMAVHGRYGKACPVCGTKIQRIVYAENESNYCPTCQTRGKLLADRALSQLLKKDWPKTLEELEERKRNPGGSS